MDEHFKTLLVQAIREIGPDDQDRGAKDATLQRYSELLVNAMHTNSIVIDIEERKRLKQMKKLALTYPNQELAAQLIAKIDFQLAWLKLRLNSVY